MPKPKLITYYDGESGKELVKMTLEQARACSHQGECDGDVFAHLDKVEWLAPLKSMRKFLKGFGAWDDCDKAPAETIRMRTLWIAAGDISENPKDYGA